MRNVIVGIISQALIVIIGFVSRKVLIVTLGYEIAGLNGWLTPVISALALTELGIGTAIICNLYKPLADKNEQAITSLVQFYAKAYRWIGLIVLVLGLAITPFLNLLIKNPIDPTYLAVVFLLFLSDTVISYFFAHKRSLIFADQRNDIVMTVSTISTITASLVQIVILLITKNYILYLTIKVIIRVIENIVIARVADKRYPYIIKAPHIPLDKEVKGCIVSNTKALSLHYVGNYLINGTDNIIISKFLGLIINAFYSNYLLILTTLRTLISQFSTGIMASFGNMLAEENSDKSNDVFKKAYFMNFAIYNFASVALLCLLNPFITLWIGSDALLSMPVVMILSLNFYITGISELLGSLRTSAGIFQPDKYLHIALSVLNLVVSIGLVQVIGIFGVFLGTLLCLLIKEVTVLPRIVYKRILNVPVREYYKKLIRYFFTTLLSAGATAYLCFYVLPFNGLPGFLLKCIMCILIPNGLVYLFYRKTKEFVYARELVKTTIIRIRSKEVKAN
jgi:O-antigen/teichoic acid export membrane protein